MSAVDLYDLPGVPRQALFEGQGPVYEAGFALPPDKPGLGLGFDEAVAKKRPYTPFNRHQLRFPDGGIADP